MKTCNVCKIEKSLDEFHKDKTHSHGRAGTCKVCNRIRSKKNYEANKEKIHKRSRVRYLRDTYGLTPEQYKDMIKEQDGVCAICGEPEWIKVNGKVRRIPIDHCHKTGQVRGLLCSNCNTGLGAFKDNIDIMASAISYLQNATYKKTGS